MKRKVAVFDFDGTITNNDTLIEFIRFSKGDFALFCGLFINSPWLLAYKLGLYPNWKAKQRFFSYFFKNQKYEDFKEKGALFAGQVRVRMPTMERLQEYQSQGATIYVITASVEDWVKPFCREHGIDNVLGTQIDVQDGLITGRFSTRNCYGEEKVRRLLEVEPDRSNYVLYAYGDSEGDAQMIKFADEGHMISR